MAGNYRTSKSIVKFVAVALASAIAVIGCKDNEPPTIPALSSNDSVGGGGSTTPISKTPKNVKIDWTASKALGVPAGGYKVYVRLNAAPTKALTTPTTVANSGGLHTTTTTLSLAPGKYYVSVTAYSADGESPLSTPYAVTVP